MPAPPPTLSLDDLRREIDEIDSAIHDLLMRRSEVGQSLRAVKGDAGVFIRPGREAQILRRLVARHKGRFSRAVVVRIWREIISTLTAMQGPLSVAVSAPGEGSDLRKLAGDHYGFLTKVTAYESDLGVLGAVTEGVATVGLLPLPHSDEAGPWWLNLAQEGKGVPRVVARLPFAVIEQDRQDESGGLAVALMRHEKSGLDRSLIVLETAEPISRSAIKELLARVALRVVDMRVWTEGADRRMHLAEVDGYVSDHDPRFESLAEIDTEVLKNAWAIGGYAVPLSPAELAGDGEA